MSAACAIVPKSTEAPTLRPHIGRYWSKADLISTNGNFRFVPGADIKSFTLVRRFEVESSTLNHVRPPGGPLLANSSCWSPFKVFSGGCTTP